MPRNLNLKRERPHEQSISTIRSLVYKYNKKTPNQPDYTGDLELSDEVINDLVEQMSRGNPKPSAQLAGRRPAKRLAQLLLL